MSDIHVIPCVGCVAAKLSRGNKFPVFCDILGNRLNKTMPCFAFDPDALKAYINRMQADFVTRKDIEIMENGVSYPSEMLSAEFISQMQTVEKELAAKRIILDYVEGKQPEQ